VILPLCSALEGDTWGTGSHLGPFKKRAKPTDCIKFSRGPPVIARAGALTLRGWGSGAPSAWMEERGGVMVLFTNLLVITGKTEPDTSWRCSLKGTGAAIEVVPKKITIRY